MDDSSAVRGAIREFIEVTTHLRVCGDAGDGLAAVQKARDFCCELVLLDIAMPRSNGIETASALRSALPHAKLIGFSSLAAELGEQLIAAKTFDAVLSKFDGMAQLVHTLKILMPAPTAQESEKHPRGLAPWP